MQGVRRAAGSVTVLSSRGRMAVVSLTNRPGNGLNQPTDPQTSTMLKHIRRRLWIVALCAIVGAGVAYYHAHSKPTRYQASAQLEFGTNQAVFAQLGLPSGTAGVSTAQQATNASVAALPII